MILLVAFLQIHHSDLEPHAANDGFWSSLAPSLSSFASSSSPQHSWVKMLVCRVSVPPTSPTSNKPHITTNVLQNLVSIVTKSVKRQKEIYWHVLYSNFRLLYGTIESLVIISIYLCNVVLFENSFHSIYFFNWTWFWFSTLKYLLPILQKKNQI